ncbi:MAG: hypothetical protein Q7S97_15445, partial [Polaromonas sp.]|nr:hypothetical protein [Polaromonas sp.]
FMSDSLRFKELFPTPMKTSTQLLRKTTGESIPSLINDKSSRGDTYNFNFDFKVGGNVLLTTRVS